MHSKAFFATMLLSSAANRCIPWGSWGPRARLRARARASEKLRATRFETCRVPYHEAFVRASGKDLAKGQVALVDPI